MVQNRPKESQAFLPRRLGSINVRVQLQADVSPIAHFLHGFKNIHKIDGPFTGNEVIVLAGGGDIFVMHVTNPGK